MIDQYGDASARAAASRCGSIPASATATARRPTPAASSRSTASGTSSSTSASSGPHGTGCPITGLHMHIGSGTDLEHLSQVCGAMEQACLAVGAVDPRDQRRRRLADALSRRRAARRPRGLLRAVGRRRGSGWPSAFGHPVSLEIEPGRYLVAESGCLIAEIRAVKQMGDNLFYLLDAGFNNLARPILYGAYHPMAIAYSEQPASRPQPRRGTATRHRRRPAVRVGRHLHAGRRRLRPQPRAAGGGGRRLPGDRRRRAPTAP